MWSRRAGVFAAVMFGASGAALAASPKVAPLGANEKIAWVHAPYESGDCDVCHESNDPKKPGPMKAKGKINAVCFECHEQMQQMIDAVSEPHGAVEDGCTECHNPHNSTVPKLLVRGGNNLCLGCHEDIDKLVKEAKVKHDALQSERGCQHCHSPHGSNVPFLLNKLPSDLCMTCHDKSDVKDDKGKVLTNMAELLAKNPFKHDPVVKKDCSACHMPHGSPEFRLLRLYYPPEFYAPYDQKNYALCFKCHEKRIAEEKETTTLTKFRNGKKNLHYVHVHKDVNGRTCRACHEVHASEQPHQIRASVPFGKSNWKLRVKYEQTPTGGQCQKTCHNARSYDNK